MPSAEFEPAIPAIKRPQTYGLYGTATDTSKDEFDWIYYFNGTRDIGSAREGKRKEEEKNEDKKDIISVDCQRVSTCSITKYELRLISRPLWYV